VVRLDEQVLGGDREGGVAVGAKEEEPRVGEGVQEEVGPVFQGGSWLEPGQRQSATGMSAGEGPVVGGVAVQRRCLEGGWKSGCRRVNLQRGAHYPKVGQTAFVREEEVQWGEAGLDGQDVDGGACEAVRRPHLDLVPEDREFPRHVGCGCEHFCAIAKDREKERRCQPMAQERGQAHPGGGEPLDGHEGSLGLDQPFGEVRGGRERRCEPISEPPDFVFGGKD